jgi:two-component system response regulator HydG
VSGISPREPGDSPEPVPLARAVRGRCAGAVLATCLDVQAGRVVVVDDKLELAETLADGLRDRGYDARALGHGADALALIEAGAIEVLVTDLRMPDTDGLMLLAAALRCDPAPPVIVMTAYGAIDSATEAIRRGAFHYLSKPFKVDELAGWVERALAERAVRAGTLR